MQWYTTAMRIFGLVTFYLLVACLHVLVQKEYSAQCRKNIFVYIMYKNSHLCRFLEYILQTCEKLFLLKLDFIAQHIKPYYM